MLKQGLTLSGTLTSPKAITVSRADVSRLQSAVPIDFCSWSWQSSARASAPHAFTLSANAAHRQTKTETREQSDEPSVTCRHLTYARKTHISCSERSWRDRLCTWEPHISPFELCHVPFEHLSRNNQTSGEGVINRTAVTLMTLMMYGDWLQQKVIFLYVSLYMWIQRYCEIFSTLIIEITFMLPRSSR